MGFYMRLMFFVFSISHFLCEIKILRNRGNAKFWTRKFSHCPINGCALYLSYCVLHLKRLMGQRWRKQNKAGYTATPVACGWAGAVFELPEHLGRSSEAKDRKNIKKVKWGPTNRPTDRPTDGRTKRGVESRSTRLKRSPSTKYITFDLDLI